MSKRSIILSVASLAGVAILAGTTSMLCAQDAQHKGQARLVERRGPEMELQQNARAQVVVLFPRAGDQNGGSIGDVEVTFVESQYATQSADPAAPGQVVQPTGREIVFCAKDAENGVVSYSLDPSGNGRKMMLLARVDGETAEIRQSGGGDGVTFYLVQRPAKQKSDQARADPQANGQEVVQNIQQQPNQPPAADPNHPQVDPNQPQAQIDQAQSHQLKQNAEPGQAAIIVVYSAGVK